MKSRARAGTVLQAVALAVCGALGAGAAQTNSSEAKGADLDLLREVRDLASRFEGVRGAAFARPPLAIRAGVGVRRAVGEAEAGRILSPQRLAARGRAWESIGLGTVDTPRQLIAALCRDLRGVALDRDASRLLVDPDRLSAADFVPEDPGRPPTTLLMATGVRPDEPVVVHMLTHLLQDQRQAAPTPGESTDALLTARAWREGEANLSAIVYLLHPLGVAVDAVDLGLDPAGVLDGALMPSVGAGASAVTLRLLEFVYLEGYHQAAAALRSGGWPGVERAAATRTASRDLLHPEYPPYVPGAAPGHGIDVPPGYGPVDEDTLGEQAIVTLVSTLTGKDNLALIAGDGWVDDKLYRFEPAEADAGFTVWNTRWRDEEAAKQFFYGVERTLQARFPGAPWSREQPARKILERSGRHFRLERDGSAVRVLVAPAALAAERWPWSEAPSRGAAGPG